MTARDPLSAQSAVARAANDLLDALNGVRLRSDRVVDTADRLEAALVASGLREADCPLVLEMAVSLQCDRPPQGWWCSREKGHDGPCAARPNCILPAGCVFGDCQQECAERRARASRYAGEVMAALDEDSAALDEERKP